MPLVGPLGLAWLFVVVVLVALDGRAVPAAEELLVVRRTPRVVGLDAIFTETVTVGFLGRSGADAQAAFGRMSLELHGSMPAGFVPVELGVDADGEPFVETIDELVFSAGQRLVLAEVANNGAPGAKHSASGRDGQRRVEAEAAGRGDEPWTVELERTWRAHRRGRLALGRLALLPTGPWGLARKRLVLGADEVVQVEPALLGLSRTLALVASERWQDLGLNRMRNRRGGQTEFESLRDYVMGDEPRAIDWKAFARRGKPTVRQYEPERGQEVVLLFDCGRRMVAPVHEPGIPEWSKLDHALDAGLQFAAAVLSQGDRVGLLAFGRRLRAWVAPARSGGQFARLKHAIFDLQPTPDECDLSAALAELSARHRRKALVIVISDVADPAHVAAQASALSRGGRHRIVFAAMNDPDLTRAAADTTPAATGLRAAALAELATRQASFDVLRGYRIPVVDLDSSRAAAPMLAAWFQERRAGAL